MNESKFIIEFDNLMEYATEKRTIMSLMVVHNFLFRSRKSDYLCYREKFNSYRTLSDQIIGEHHNNSKDC